jgi:hypothetical protein
MVRVRRAFVKHAFVESRLERGLAFLSSICAHAYFRSTPTTRP